MRIREEPIETHINWINQGFKFSVAGYSDAEWYCILGERIGERTALGQVLSPVHGERLLDVLKRRANQINFFVAVPKVLRDLPAFCNGEVDWLLGFNNLTFEALERDMVTDDLAREANLKPFIDCVRTKRTTVVGPGALSSEAENVLHATSFVRIESPNLHARYENIQRTAQSVLSVSQSSELILISAGVSAACIIDLIHDERPKACILDVGSMWDAFAGIGGQREWRAKLYADPQAWAEWKRKCLYG